MKYIIYKSNLWLNKNDKIPVLVDTAIPYSEESIEYTKSASVDDKYKKESDQNESK